MYDETTEVNVDIMPDAMFDALVVTGGNESTAVTIMENRHSVTLELTAAELDALIAVLTRARALRENPASGIDGSAGDE